MASRRSYCFWRARGVAYAVSVLCRCRLSVAVVVVKLILMLLLWESVASAEDIRSGGGRVVLGNGKDIAGRGRGKWYCCDGRGRLSIMDASTGVGRRDETAEENDWN